MIVYAAIMETASSKISTSIAIAPELRASLDAEAARLDRSRSWVAAEAIRQMLARNAAGSDV